MEELTPVLQWLITRSALPLKAVETGFVADVRAFRLTAMFVGLTRNTKKKRAKKIG